MLFLTKDLLKAIMKRSRLGNKFLNNKTKENGTLYLKHKNYYVSFLR